MDGRDAMRSSYPLKADVGATADSWYPSSPITEGCRRDARLGKEQDGHLPVEMGVGRHRENEKPNSTLAKGWLQTAGTLKVESHCAELTKGFLEAEGLTGHVCAQSCPDLRDLVDCSPPGSPEHGISQPRITRVGCRFLLQGILPTQDGPVSLMSPALAGLYYKYHMGSPEGLKLTP